MSFFLEAFKVVEWKEVTVNDNDECLLEAFKVVQWKGSDGQWGPSCITPLYWAW